MLFQGVLAQPETNLLHDGRPGVRARPRIDEQVLQPARVKHLDQPSSKWQLFCAAPLSFFGGGSVDSSSFSVIGFSSSQTDRQAVQPLPVTRLSEHSEVHWELRNPSPKEEICLIRDACSAWMLPNILELHFHLRC